MSFEFHDMEIPKRRTEYALPFDLAVYFRYQEEPAGLLMEISGAGEDCVYEGRGRVALADGFIRVPELAILDPFLLEHRLIPARYFKIFFRAQYPKLRMSGLLADCELRLAETPVVLFTIRSMREDRAAFDLRWHAPRNELRTIPGFDGYVAAGNLLYRGLLRELLSIPHHMDGAYTAEGQDLRRLQELFHSAPYLFDVRDPAFTAHRAEPEPETDPVQKIFDAAAPSRRKTRDWGGPAILRTGVTPQNRPGTSKFVHFVVEAKRLVNAPAPPATFVPFTCYWPTYGNMSREQRAWYFYWRNEFYRGNPLKADLSYIFVAVYEIINRAYPVGLESLERMLSLWETYREAFPRLDFYLSQWCVDYVIANELDFSFAEVLRRIPLAVSNMRPCLEFYANDALKEGLHTLPFDVLCEFSDYKIRASRFYPGHEDLLRRGVIAALAEIDRSLREAKQVGLLQYLAPHPRREVWEAYAGAVVGRSAAKRVEMEYVPYSHHPGIRAFLGNVMRYVENALRKQEKYAGRLRGIELSDAVTRAIDRSLSAKTAVVRQEEAAPAILIDLSRAAELEQDSWDNTRRLIEAVQESQPEEELPAFDQPLPEPEPVTEEDTAPVSGEGFAALAARLEPVHRELLSAMLRGEDSAALAAIAMQAFSFPEALYDDINELAADTIGDILIDAELNEIYEEHRDALAAELT